LCPSKRGTSIDPFGALDPQACPPPRPFIRRLMVVVFTHELTKDQADTAAHKREASRNFERGQRAVRAIGCDRPFFVFPIGPRTETTEPVDFFETKVTTNVGERSRRSTSLTVTVFSTRMVPTKASGLIRPLYSRSGRHSFRIRLRCRSLSKTC
jgi:hypothetical protein